jgi:integrase
MTLLGEQPDGTKTEHDYCATLHELPVGEVDIGAVLDVLKPIWASKPETASRLRGRIEKVIDFAIVHGLAGDVGPEHQNPARWKGRLEHALPAKGEVRETKHHAALPYEAVPAFMKTLRTREGAAAHCLELAVLTETRTGDLIGSDREERPPMRWEHVDLEKRLWTVPKKKTNVEPRVPLSGAAVALLERVRREHPDDGSGIVFGGDKRGEPLSNGAMLRVCDRMVKDGLIAEGAMTTHGMRAAFKSWAGDETAFVLAAGRGYRPPRPFRSPSQRWPVRSKGECIFPQGRPLGALEGATANPHTDLVVTKHALATTETGFDAYQDNGRGWDTSAIA